ncbi:universal stress protein [Microbacterium azadirachtae]|uniref:universal stress protein n=1 Tax=Microbacterium azadirachtae TaxID=582680 RepID=UPI00088B9D0B|nr:universal stress protein [Microbacterium azadirachtae]SDL88360.1 Nucleotide-binding universal stress protein, UspA family [Microbacterium azadirachtae]SEG18987.1 Nucleotide-binding universal stress protein, UspA family [Microbacterium azadirachtae]SEG21322.1 Nucleotide-binding universal stress protein, UspA family [Microbacterium azadirachtae]
MSVLVGVDTGRRSESVLALAAQLANSLQTDLVVAAVVASAWPPSRASVDHEWREHHHAAADLVLDHAASVFGGQVKARYLVHEASSARRGLLELAEQEAPDALVLGSSAQGETGRIALGAVSEALLHASPVPVAIAPVGYRAGLDSRIVRLTAGYGGTEAAEDLVLGAATVAARAGGALRIASFAVRPEAETGILSGAGGRAEDPVLIEWVEQIRRHASAIIDEVEELDPRPRFDDAVIGVGGSWAAAIDDIGWGEGELLVVGSSSLNPIARVFLGSHGVKIVRNSPVPALVVPRAAAWG